MRARRAASSVVCAALAALTVLTLCAVTAQGSVLGPNLVVNGDAERDIDSEWTQLLFENPFNSTGPPVRSGYNSEGHATSPGNLADGGSFNGGGSFFSGGNQGLMRTRQFIMLTPDQVAQINSGQTSSYIEAYIGGYAAQLDNLVVEVEWKGGSNIVEATLGRSLLTQILGPVNAPDRAFRTGFVRRDHEDLIPAGARWLVITLTGKRIDLFGGNVENDGWIDNLSVRFSSPDLAVLRKTFDAPSTPPGKPVRLTFRVDNTATNTPRRGWTFTDNLQDGLAVADTPNVDTNCSLSSAVDADAGAESITASGDVAASASCFISVNVVSKGRSTLNTTYFNGAAEMTAEGLIEPASPAVLQISAPKPTVTFKSPPAGATLAQEASQVGEYTCASATGTVESCAASVAPGSGVDSESSLADGETIPTDTPGTYTITVVAEDSYGQITTASRSYVVAAPPTVKISAPVSGAIYASGHRATASFSCASVASTIASCAAALQPPTGATEALDSGAVLATAAEGSYTITLTAKDALGQTTTTTSTYVVASGPVAMITTPAAGSAYAPGHGDVSSFSCGSALSTIATCAATLRPPAGPEVALTSGDVVPTTVLGSYTITLAVEDALGQKNSATRTYVVGNLPIAAITRPAAGAVMALRSATAASFSCDSAESTIATCTATVKPPSGPAVGLTNDSNVPASVAGRYAITVTAKNARGQTSTATSPYVVAALPVATIATPARGTIVARQSTTTDSTFSCASAASTIATCSATVKAPSGGPVALTSRGSVPTTMDGLHTITATATDVLGQTGTATRTYEVTCLKKVAFGLVEIKTTGCLLQSGTSEHPRYETTSSTSVNGIALPAPPPGTRFVAVAPTTAHPGGQIQLAAASIKLGSLTAFDGKIDWDLPRGEKGSQATVATLAVPSGAKLQGLQVNGSISLVLGYGSDGQHYATFPMEISLPKAFTSSPGRASGGVSAKASVRVDSAGIHYDGLKLQVSGVYIGSLRVDSACLSYVPARASEAVEPCPMPELKGQEFIKCASNADTDRWDGSAVMTLPTKARPKLSVFGGLADGDISKLGGFVEKLGTSVPLVQGVYLDSVGVGLCLTPPPLKLKGTVGVTIQPAPESGAKTTSKKATVAIDGSITYTDSDESNPWSLVMKGEVFVFGEPVASGGVTIRPTGLIDFDATMHLDRSLLSVQGGVSGFVNTSDDSFNVAGNVKVCVSELCKTAKAVVSSVGVAGCLGVANYPYVTWRGAEMRELMAGAGYKWGGTVSVFAGSCDMGSYNVNRPRSLFRSMMLPGDTPTIAAPAAQSALNFTAVTGAPALTVKVSGSDGPPSVVLHGPSGETITDRGDASGFAQSPGHWMLVQNPEDNSTTVLLIKPSAGAWTVTQGSGEVAPISVQTAAFSPPPVFEAKVLSTHRDSKTLSVTYMAADGASVSVVEEGKVGGVIIAKVHGHRCGRGIPASVGGTRVLCAKVPFAPTAGPGGRRNVFAVVTNPDGTPRAKTKIASYVAPRELLPGLPAGLRIRRVNSPTPGRTGVIVSWRRSGPTQSHTVAVALSSGAKFGLSTKRCSAVYLAGVPSRVAVNVTVAGMRTDMRTGPHARTRLAPRRASVGTNGPLKRLTCRRDYDVGSR
ncbi:MAG TPA: hypothetical protein VGO80_03995 [Solirubrobacteraceae bacterium]|jgi:hypothetical protein|nr:hypothetical protein [Solirubrobacteraceae bacterium]